VHVLCGHLLKARWPRRVEGERAHTSAHRSERPSAVPTKVRTHARVRVRARAHTHIHARSCTRQAAPAYERSVLRAPAAHVRAPHGDNKFAALCIR
jgi:hypothetical protein